MDLPKRKHTRLKSYDYSQNGCYFVTFCVKGKKHLLGSIRVGRDAHIPPTVKLTACGEITKQYIESIPSAYTHISLQKYVIMPNHVHLLLLIDNPYNRSGGMWASRPTLHTIIRSTKTMITKQLGYSIWQDSFYEKIIDSEKGYQEAWQYIDENPAKWLEKKSQNGKKQD